MANPKSLDYIEDSQTFRAVQIFGEGSDGLPDPYTITSGGLDVTVKNIEDNDTSSSIEHVASGTAATGSSVAGSWIDRSDYDKGVIVITLTDGAPAGDLGGEFQIQYSLDAGVTPTTLETLVAVANIGADDSQVLIVDLSSIKNAPYFKVGEAVTGTLTSVTYGVDVYLNRFRG